MKKIIFIMSLIAFTSTHVYSMEASIDNSINATVRIPNHWTPLMVAAQNGNVKLVKNLIEAGADVNNKGGTSALKIAISNGHPKIVKILIKSGANVNSKYACTSPLNIAVERGNQEIVQKLLDAGANVNAKGHKTALMQAALHGHRKIVIMLLARKADPNCYVGSALSYYYGKTVLTLTERKGYQDIVRILKAAGAQYEPQEELANMSLHKLIF